MLHPWNDFDTKVAEVEESEFKAKNDLWLKAAEHSSKDSTGTAAFSRQAMEHLLETADAES